jgi:16S rRNA (uracil1498-N3)-methyltransferase
VRLSRIYVREKEISSGRVVFAYENARYVRSVLRLKPGDQIVVFDGYREHLVRLTASHLREVSGQIVGSVVPDGEHRLEMTLAFCCVRPNPVIEILRHGTELGVSRFVPLLSRRATRRPPEKKTRWDSIVAAASAQSGRIQLPIVEPPAHFDEFVRRKPVSVTGVLLSTSPDAPLMLALLEHKSPHSICLVVGPEGGLDQSEEADAIGQGFLPVSLGSVVLKTETAAILAAGIAAIWYQRNRVKEPQGTHQ